MGIVASVAGIFVSRFALRYKTILCRDRDYLGAKKFDFIYNERKQKRSCSVDMMIYDMKVNHLTNPLGFRMMRTVFSWKVKDAAGKRQTQARIRIASDDAMTDILADTGWDAAADSLGYKVSFALEPVTRYYWTVAVQSDAGEEAVSDVQWFETGKGQQPWAGKWISCDNTEKRHPYFEKEISPAKKVESARLYICGLGLYEAFYNGERIGSEYLTPYSNDYNEWVQYQTYDVTEHLKRAGKLSVLLGNGWYKERFGQA